MHRSSAILAALVFLVPTAARADDDTQASAPEPSAPSLQQTPSAGPVARAASPSRPSDGAQPRQLRQATLANGGYVVPQSVPYEGGAIPAFSHIEERPNTTLVRAGFGVLGAAYGVSLIYALSTCGAQMDCRAGSAWLYVPVLGPFITAAQAPTTGGAALSAFDGGVQVLGAVLAVAGVAAPDKFVVWQGRTARLSLAPTSGASQGVSASLGVTLTHL